MLEALVLSLSLMDQSYYLKEDLRERFMGLLESLHGQQIAILIGCPKLWDMQTYKEFPVYTAYKWPEGVLIKSYPPADFGYIVVSSLTNGGIRIFPLVENPEKIPLPESSKKSPPPPGANVNKITVSYDTDWKLLPSEHMQWAGEKIAIAILCGPTVSNVCSILLTNAAKGIPAVAPTASIKSSGYYFVKNKQSPPIPDATGISFSSPEGRIVYSGEPFPLYGSFNVPGTENKDICIHLLFSQPTIPGLVSYPVIIPKNAFKISNGMAHGYFIFDMMETMYWKPGERFDIPVSLFISGVYKNVFSTPMVMNLKRDK
jgi:hypothetical protein